MTRINTNISSLISQNRLRRTNEDLQTSLTRLSTGLRINTGKDDPAGLIASEALRSDITSLNKAISNTQRAVQIIATADSALGQVSTILNTMRGLIVEAANRGAMSDAEIAANQLQIDSSLDAINRIAKTTTFQGRKLLDGSLDFISNVRTLAPVVDAQIDQANLGTSGNMNVAISVEAAATRAQLTSSALTVDNAQASLSFTARASDVLGDITVTSASLMQDITIVYQHDGGLAADTLEAEFDANTATLTVRANGSTDTSITKQQVADAIDALADFTATADAGTASDPAGDFASGGTPPSDGLLSAGSIALQSTQSGFPYNNVSIVLQSGAAAGAEFNATQRTLTVTYVPGTSTLADLATAINDLAEFEATATSGGAGLATAADSAVTANTGLSGGGILLEDVVFEMIGTYGAETFNFQAGTNHLQIVAAINLVSDATGVQANFDEATGMLSLESNEYGSRSMVAINVIHQGSAGTFSDSLSAIRSDGTDIVARVNGIAADGYGNQLSINTSTLTLRMTLDPEQPVNDLFFSITGGGALFQLGGEVVSNQQARMGIGSMSTSTLGGVSGRLYELASGQAKALTNDITGAGRVINEVIGKVTSLRGRLGAFQATTLESNLVSLTDTIGNLTEAESLIRDADFAAETARLTRSQILVQSGTVVLGIANQNPQNVLRLLQ